MVDVHGVCVLALFLRATSLVPGTIGVVISGMAFAGLFALAVTISLSTVVAFVLVPSLLS